jgi:hypothetical protein
VDLQGHQDIPVLPITSLKEVRRQEIMGRRRLLDRTTRVMEVTFINFVTVDFIKLSVQCSVSCNPKLGACTSSITHCK